MLIYAIKQLTSKVIDLTYTRGIYISFYLRPDLHLGFRQKVVVPRPAVPRDSRGEVRRIRVAAIEVEAVQTRFVAGAVPPATLKLLSAVVVPFVVVLVYC